MMSDRFTVEKIDRSRLDIVMIAILILLTGVGLATLFSSSYYYAQRLTGDPQFFFKQQLARMLLGVLFAFVLSRISLDALRKTIPALLFLALLLMILSFVPGIGLFLNDSRRWILLFGVSFQPSELVKFVLILYLAHLLSKKEERLDDIANTIVPPIIVTVVFVTLAYLQNDFSTAMFLGFISLAMLFMAGIKFVYFILFSAVAVPLTFVLIFTKEYRVQRIMTFLDPERDPIGTGFQVIAARSALARGGLWGSGMGLGTKKLGGLPEAHSDFVFAVLGEETGYIGVLFVIALFVVFAFRGYQISVSREDRFGYLLGFGLTTCILSQALFNTAVVSGLIPTTGIPLPFFSHGGSSLLITLCMCGVLLNLSRSDAERGRLAYE